MIVLFKKLRNLEIIIAVTLLIIFLAAEFHFINPQSDPATTILLMTLYIYSIVLTTCIFRTIATKKHNKILLKLNENCDPYDFLNNYIGFAGMRTNTNLKALILLNLTAGYINTGDFAQAKVVMADAWKLTGKNPIILTTSHLMQVSISCYENDIITAQQELAAAKAIIDTAYINKPAKIQILNTYNINAARINIYNNCFENTEQLLLQSLNNAQYACTRVCINNCLYELYKKQNRTEEAHQALTYVAEHGNKLAVAEEARQLLSNWQ